MANHTFSPVNWGGQHPQSPTTGAHQYAAGSGQHAERMARSHEIRAAYEVPHVASPLNTNEVHAFVAEWEQVEADTPHTAARIVGGVLGYKIVRHAMNRRLGR
jgi:hypothetical protein